MDAKQITGYVSLALLVYGCWLLFKGGHVFVALGLAGTTAYGIISQAQAAK